MNIRTSLNVSRAVVAVILSSAVLLLIHTPAPYGAPPPGKAKKLPPEAALQGHYAFSVHGHDATAEHGAVAYTGWMELDGQGGIPDCFVFMTQDGEQFTTTVVEDPFANNLCNGSYDVSEGGRQGALDLKFTASGFGGSEGDHRLAFALALAEKGARVFLHLTAHQTGGREGTLILTLPETATGEALPQ